MRMPMGSVQGECPRGKCTRVMCEGDVLGANVQWKCYRGMSRVMFRKMFQGRMSRRMPRENGRGDI